MLTDGVIALREPTEADVHAIVAAVQDPDAARWTSIPSPYRPAAARDWIDLDEHRFLIVDADERLLGAVGLLNPESEPELGYWLAREARGRGAATRAVALVRDWAATVHGARRVILLIHEDNIASQRVAERAGFADTGERRPCPRGCRRSEAADHRVYAWTAP